MKYIIHGILSVVTISASAAIANQPLQATDFATTNIQHCAPAATIMMRDALMARDVTDDILKLIPAEHKKSRIEARQKSADELLNALTKPPGKTNPVKKKSISSSTDSEPAKSSNPSPKLQSSTAAKPNPYNKSKSNSVTSVKSQTTTVVVKKADLYPAPQTLSFEKAKEIADKLYAENKSISVLPFLNRMLSLKEDCATLYRRARTLNKLHQYSLAIADYSKILSSCKVDGNTILLEKADILSNAGRASEALSIVESEMNRTSPLDTTLVDAKVAIFKNANRNDDAINYLTSLIQQRPTDAHYYSLRSNAYLLKFDFDSALKDANRQIELSNDADAFLSRARVEFQMHQNNECIADSNQAIRLNPKEKQSYIFVGTAEFELKNLDKVKESAEQLLRIDASSGEALGLLGRVHLEKKEYEAAINYLARAIEVVPSDSGNYIFIYNTYRDNKQPAEASNIVDLASKYCDQDANYWFLKAIAAFDRKDYAEAATDAANSSAKNPYFSAANYYRALADYNLKKYSEAIGDADFGLQRNPKPAILTYLVETKAKSLAKLNRKEEAYSFVDKRNSSKSEGYVSARYKDRATSRRRAVQRRTRGS